MRGIHLAHLLNARIAYTQHVGIKRLNRHWCWAVTRTITSSFLASFWYHFDTVSQFNLCMRFKLKLCETEYFPLYIYEHLLSLQFSAEFFVYTVAVYLPHFAYRVCDFIKFTYTFAVSKQASKQANEWIDFREMWNACAISNALDIVCSFTQCSMLGIRFVEKKIQLSLMRKFQNFFQLNFVSSFI